MLFLKTALLGFVVLWSAFYAADRWLPQSAASHPVFKASSGGSLENWRLAEAKKKRTGNASAVVLPHTPPMPVTTARLAYERDLPLMAASSTDVQPIRFAAVANDVKVPEKQVQQPLRVKKIVKRAKNPRPSVPAGPVYAGFDNAFARW